MPIERFRFFVPGKPVQQGSKTAFAVQPKGGGRARAVVTDANAGALKPYRTRVAAAAAAAFSGRLEGAVAVRLYFGFERGKTVTREFMTTTPDIDKLERAVLDSLTMSKTIRDDAQVVSVSKQKFYSDTPGVLVVVGEYKSGEVIA